LKALRARTGERIFRAKGQRGMDEPKKSNGRDGLTEVSRRASLGFALLFFVGFAVTEPIFRNPLLDMPLYLALALASVLVFFAVIRIMNSRSNLERIGGGGKPTTAFWFAYVVAAFVAAIAFLAAAGVLAALFSR
jgi:hypothetical protein